MHNFFPTFESEISNWKILSGVQSKQVIVQVFKRNLLTNLKDVWLILLKIYGIWIVRFESLHYRCHKGKKEKKGSKNCK